jgi:hypothetical protein
MTRFDKGFRLLFIPATLALTLGAFNADDRMLKKAGEAIKQTVYRGHVAGLSSDEMQGREPGSEGERKTLEYLEKEFLELGLQPVAGGDFRQDVALVEITGSDQKLAFSRAEGGLALAQGDDMVINSRRVQSAAAVAGSKLVFVGYGIHAPEFGWNDYAGIDMRGKTALILVNDPGFVTGDDTLFRGKAMTYHGRWTYKFEEASRQGAAAAIIVHETAPASYDWGVVQQLVGPPVLPRSRGWQCGPDGTRRLDHRSACAPGRGAGGAGFRRAEGGRSPARLPAGATRRERDRQRQE